MPAIGEKHLVVATSATVRRRPKSAGKRHEHSCAVTRRRRNARRSRRGDKTEDVASTKPDASGSSSTSTRAATFKAREAKATIRRGMEVRLVEAADHKTLTQVLARAFDEDPIQRWVFPSTGVRDR